MKESIQEETEKSRKIEERSFRGFSSIGQYLTRLLVFRDSMTHAIRDIPSNAGVVIVRCSSLGLFVDRIFNVLKDPLVKMISGTNLPHDERHETVGPLMPWRRWINGIAFEGAFEKLLGRLLRTGRRELNFFISV